MSAAMNLGMMRGYVVVLGVLYICVMTFAWASPDKAGVANLAEFNRVQVSGPLNVTIRQDVRTSVITTDSVGVDVESVDGTLYIEAEELVESVSIVEVSMPTIHELVVVGAADVSVSGFTGDTIVIDASHAGEGVGHITANRIWFDHLLVTGAGQFDFNLHGRATHQDISLAGNGRYTAEGLQTETSMVSVTGTGEVSLWAEKILDLKAADNAQVIYRGSPWVNKQLSDKAHIHTRYPLPPKQTYPKRYTTSL